MNIRVMRVVHSAARRMCGPRGALGTVPRVTSLSSSCVLRPKGSTRNRKNHHAMKKVDRKSTRLNSSHVKISYAVFCLKKKTRKFATEQKSHKQIIPRHIHAKCT